MQILKTRFFFRSIALSIMFLPLVFVKLNVVFKTQFFLHMFLEVRATVAYFDTVSFAAISLIDDVWGLLCCV